MPGQLRGQPPLEDGLDHLRQKPAGAGQLHPALLSAVDQIVKPGVVGHQLPQLLAGHPARTHRFIVLRHRHLPVGCDHDPLLLEAPTSGSDRTSYTDHQTPPAPDHQRTVKDPLVIDLDATLVTAHSEKELAAATFKRGFGFHPIGAWVDHGQGGTGEPVAMLLRPGNAGSNTAADHIKIVKAALAQVPSTRADRRPGCTVLIRADGAGGTHEFLDWLTCQRVQYSVGFTLSVDTAKKLDALPDDRRGPRRTTPTAGHGTGHGSPNRPV